MNCFRIYAKAPGDKKFLAMDMENGCQTKALIYATIYPSDKENYVDDFVNELNQDNPDWKFEKGICNVYL